MVLVPSAQTAASSIAMPARMSGEIIEAPCIRLGPATMARWGSHNTMRAPIEISLSTKNIRDSNIFSNIRITPSHWVAVTMAIDIRSAGKAGPGWSSGFGAGPGRCLEFRHVPAEIILDLERLPRRHDKVIAFNFADDAEPFKAHPDRAQ